MINLHESMDQARIELTISESAVRHIIYFATEPIDYIKRALKKWAASAVEHERATLLVVLFVLLLYVPSQQLWSWRDGQFTYPQFFLGKLEQAINHYFVHILSLVTDNNPS